MIKRSVILDGNYKSKINFSYTLDLYEQTEVYPKISVFPLNIINHYNTWKFYNVIRGIYKKKDPIFKRTFK